MTHGILVKTGTMLVLPVAAFFLGRYSVNASSKKATTVAAPETVSAPLAVTATNSVKVPGARTDLATAGTPDAGKGGSKKPLSQNSLAVQELLDAASDFVKQGREKDAMLKVNEALALNPNDPDLLANAGGFYLTVMQNPTKAAELFQQAYNANPEKLEAFNGLVNSLFGMEDQQAAIEKMKSVFENNPDRFEPSLALGDMYMKSGKKAEAMQAFENARRVNDKDPQVYQRIADYYSSEKQPAKAAEALAQAESRVDSYLKEKLDKELTAPRMEKDKLNIRMNRVNLLAASGKGQEALALLDEARPQLDDEAYRHTRQRIVQSGQRSN